ncbi:MAG: hypothetical protein PQJ45_08975 [Sphaerochaetaceae bacterium]|nr:hypothetical protein [Sphaerochaetaceae bacterium]
MSKIKYKNIVLFSFVSMIIIFLLITNYITKNFDFKLAETMFFLTVPKFIETSKNFRPEHIHSYIIMATSIDIIWPISYCLFFFIINEKLILHKKKKKLVNIYILFIFLIDMSENYLTARYLMTNNNKMATLSVLATNLKWLSIFFIIIISIIGIVKYFKKK